MCAIAGMMNLYAPDAVVMAMGGTMRRRGPDDFGVFRGEDVTLLHARLAVIDIAGGRQPMTLRANGETYTIVYNGELYNTPELRQELRKLGHAFEGHSDTEVVLHAYAQWGADCVDRFNGIFAFAIWDTKKQLLFI